MSIWAEQMQKRIANRQKRMKAAHLAHPRVPKSHNKGGEEYRRQKSKRRGKDLRGNSADRRARKLWMLSKYGNGEFVKCHWCPEILDINTLEADRFPKCGHRGGRYTRDNVVPACRHCNATRCNSCVKEYKAIERSPSYG